MNKTIPPLSFLLTLLLVCPLTTWAKRGVPSAESILDSARADQLRISTLSGDITREISTTDSSLALTSGRFYWEHPRFRMDLTQPKETHTVFDGERLLVQVPSEHEFRIKEVAESTGFSAGTETPWLPSLDLYRNGYDFRVVGQGPIEGHDVWVLEGAARDTGRQARRVMIWIGKSDFEPLRLETYDTTSYPTTIYLVDSLAEVDSARVPVRFESWAGAGSQVLHFVTTLSRLRLNEPLDEELFHIALPAEHRR